MGGFPPSSAPNPRPRAVFDMRARLRNGEMNVERELGEQGMTEAEGPKEEENNRFPRPG